MIRILKRSASLVAMTALGFSLAVSPASASTKTPPLSEAQTEYVRDLIQKTLVEHPEIIMQAMQALKDKQAAAMASAQTKAIHANRDALIHADDPFLGAKKPAIHVVEFFDYNCGYCRAAFPDILKVTKTIKDVQIIIKELPVLGPDSIAVSRLALAAREQGKYNAFHIALMESDSRLTEASALDIAKGLGIDIKRLKVDAKSDKVDTILQRNHLLTRHIGIQGTPAFIIGDTLFPGKIDVHTLTSAIDKERKAKSSK